MSIKYFGKGIGSFDHPFDTQSSVKVDVTDNSISFVQDTTVRPMVRPTNEEFAKRLESKNRNLDTLQTTIPYETQDVRRNIDIYPNQRQVVNTGIKPQQFSAESGNAPFETFFHDFNIEAFPFYNFWTPDELTNERDERGERKFEDIPRYIKITWNSAPDLPDPEERVRPKMVDKRNIRDVMFSREIERPKVFNSKGIGFSPGHLQPSGFSKLKGIIANGHAAPGVLETVIEIPLHNTGVESHDVLTSKESINHLDEDSFLTNPEFAGISINELKAQVNQLTNGIAGMTSIAKEGVSDDLTERKEDLVNGKFMITKPVFAGGSAQITGIHPSSPTFGFESKFATPAKTLRSDPVMEIIESISQPPTINDVKSSIQIKAKFFNPAVGGLVSESKVNLMSAPHHAETLSAVAMHLPSLEILSRTNLFDRARTINIPSLPSPKVKPLEYVGYVLEKYKRQSSGVFTKVEEIDIGARDADYYIDTKIVYGEVYRYRIRAVIRWTRENNKDANGKDPFILMTPGSHASPISAYKSSYFYSEWGHNWAYASCIDNQPPPPPDELVVRPDSSRKRVIITCRLPDNPQRDILKMRLFRKYQDKYGNDISSWIPISENGALDRGIDFAPANLYFVDNDNGRIGFSQEEDGMRRVYAAQCISRHGEYSTLSEQLAVKLNSDYFTRGEFPVEFISSPGIRLEYFGAFSTIPFKITKSEVVAVPPQTDVGKSPGVATLRFDGRSTVGNVNLSNADYICRIQSLDTGEIKDVPFSLTVQNFQARQEVAEFDFYIPTHSIANRNSNNFKRLDDKEIVDNRNNQEVHVYDRSAPGESWKA